MDPAGQEQRNPMNSGTGSREPSMQASSDWEEDDSYTASERKRDTSLGAVPFSFQNAHHSMDGVSEQDRQILMTAAYHSHVQKQMNQKQQMQQQQRR